MLRKPSSDRQNWRATPFSTERPKGGNKARDCCLWCYTQMDAPVFEAVICAGIASCRSQRTNDRQYDRRYTVDMWLTGPAGRGMLRVGQPVDTGSAVPRLTPALYDETEKIPMIRAYQELEVVTALVDVPASRGDAAVRAGDVGTIVHIATRPNLAYMVEFVDGDGVTLAMPFLLPDQIALWAPPIVSA